MQDHPAGRFVFTATGPAYFRIWIVNLMLSVATLGIYSPWAKVRRLRYFYGHTLFDDSPFEFHGRPIALLKGRLIGVVLLASQRILGTAKPSARPFAAYFAAIALVLVAAPWFYFGCAPISSATRVSAPRRWRSPAARGPSMRSRGRRC